MEEQAQPSQPSTNQAPALTPKQQLENIQQVRDLFARAHDFIAQANHPGHLGMKVAEVLNFLKFHYEDFKLRADNLAKTIQTTIESQAKAEASKVDVNAAKAATEAVLSAQKSFGDAVAQPEAQEQPKA